jgi:hypothetical protein
VGAIAAVKEERDVVDRLDVTDGLLQQAAADRKVLLERLHVEQRPVVGRAHP